ncbi:toll-like receptor 1, partial [Chanos chanos]|uniref:Toll-like receptor 1 n=1 Tax=Chanos chanos TaxID=29144 RepID=A0A6J2UME1_CHACN
MALLYALGLVAVFIGSLSVSSPFQIETLIVYLASKNLTSVPSDLPSTTEALDLSQNRIQSLSKQDFLHTPGLRFLNLSWNMLQDIDPETFHSTPALQTLDLSHNRLLNLSDQQYLKWVSSLQYLNLSFNLFTVMTLGKEFSGLGNLQWLSLSADLIQKEDFVSVRNIHLQDLTLHLETLKGYEMGSLSETKAKKIVLMVSNHQVDEDIIADAFESFIEVELTGFIGLPHYLRKLIAQQGVLRVTHLYISALRVTWLELTKTVNAILQSTIRKLSMSNITLTAMSIGDPVTQQSSLESFSIEQAAVTTFIFDQRALYNFFINIHAQNLTLAQTPIVHMTCPTASRKVYMLDLSYDALSQNVFSSDKGECKTLDNLEILLLRGNNLHHLQPLSLRVQYMRALRHLDLSQNVLTYSEDQGTCLWPSNIEHLDLSANEFDQSIFKCLPRGVKALNLQNNQIAAIPSNSSFLYALEVLDLTSNRLVDLPCCLDFPSLRVLGVQRNSLHAPSPSALQTCPSLSILDASRNPYICTCALRGFTALFQETGTHGGKREPKITLFHWPNGYLCSYPESWRKKPLRDFHLPEISCNASLLAVTILVPAVTVMIAIAMLCHKLDAPWYLSMIWKWTRAKHRARISQSRSEDLQGVYFHAFVSYSQRDAEWVKSQLLPKLEGEGSTSTPGALRICHHERHFIPGKSIVQNILRCTEQSRRCIFVLSSHFVQSEWCHYELYFANHQRLTRGLDSIILVLLEPLPSYLIPAKYYQLKEMMARRTYLEWPQDKAKQRLFWANLRAALQANLTSQPQTDTGV